MTVDEAGRQLGVSASTVWRMIRRGELPSFLERGRRVVPQSAVTTPQTAVAETRLPPFRSDNPLFRLAGAGRSGGRRPGARDKHAILDHTSFDC